MNIIVGKLIENLFVNGIFRFSSLILMAGIIGDVDTIFSLFNLITS